MSHGLFITHRAKPGRRADLIAAWEQHMPAVVQANPHHEAYVCTRVVQDPDAVMVYQQYTGADEAAAFLREPAYRAYLDASEHLLASPPSVTLVEPLWTKDPD